MGFGALARSAIAFPEGKLSSAARLMRNSEMEHFCMQSVKKVLFERLYVLIYLRPISEDVAIPHPPLRGTFPPGEGIGPPNSILSGSDDKDHGGWDLIPQPPLLKLMGKLAVIELCVEAALLQKLPVLSFFHNVPVPHD